MDGEVVNTLLRLVLKNVDEVIGQLFDVFCNLKCLINRDGSHWDRQASIKVFRMPSMSPVEMLIIVSAPCLRQIASFRNSFATSLVTALLPMFAFTLQESAIPIPIGSSLECMMFAGMMSLPRAIPAANKLRFHVLAFGDIVHLFGDHASLGKGHLSYPATDR